MAKQVLNTMRYSSHDEKLNALEGAALIFIHPYSFDSDELFVYTQAAILTADLVPDGKFVIHAESVAMGGGGDVGALASLLHTGIYDFAFVIVPGVAFWIKDIIIPVIKTLGKRKPSRFTLGGAIIVKGEDSELHYLITHNIAEDEMEGALGQIEFDLKVRVNIGSPSLRYIYDRKDRKWEPL